MLRWLIGIIVGDIIFPILTLSAYAKIDDHYVLGANWQLFRVETMARCSYLILIGTKDQVATDLYMQRTPNLCCQAQAGIEVDFHLGINPGGPLLYPPGLILVNTVEPCYKEL